jgi:ubiquinone biosynthesis accessory factor UbiJ
MFRPLITHLLQHITHQNNWARPYLSGFSGQIIQFNFVITKTNLLILEDGGLCIAGETAAPNAIVTIPPSLGLRLLSKDEAAKSYIKVDGDIHLATEVSKVLQHMRWDAEEDLSKLVGDVAAYKITKVGKDTLSTLKQQGQNAAEMLTEYWQEEKNILAKKRHVTQFNQAVDALREDADRLEKRIEKLLAGTIKPAQIKPKTTVKKSKPTQESDKK